MGGQLFSYVAGTTTPQATYTDSTGGTQNPNPVILNARGEAPVWLNPSQTYKFILEDALGNTLWTADNVPGGYTPGGALSAQIIGQLLWPQTAAEAAAGVTPTNYGYPSGNVLRYGADPTGATNSNLAFAAAGNVAAQQLGAQSTASGIVYVPAGLYNLTTALSYASGTILQGAGCFTSCVSATPGPQGGSIIQFANAITGAALTMGVGGQDLPCQVRDLSVTRVPSGASPPAGTIGIAMNAGSNVVLDNVLSYNHSIGIQFNGASGIGGGATLTNVYTGYISDAHLVNNGWDGISATNCMFGMAGSGNNISSNAYTRMQGGTAGSPGPSNTFFVNCRFHQSTQTTLYLMEFSPTTATPGEQLSGFGFTNCSVASVTNSLMATAVSWSTLQNTMLIGNSFNCPSAAVLGLNSATNIVNMFWSGNHFNVALVGLNGGGTLNAVNISDNAIGAPLTLTGVLPSYVQMTNNTYGGNVSVTGSFTELTLNGNQTGGSFNYSASSQYIDIGGSFAQGTWTPQLAFGGGSSGLTQTTNNGRYVILGQYVHAEFEIALSALGSSTGNATVGGFPFTCIDSIGGGVMTSASGMSLLASPITVSTIAGGNTVGMSNTGSSGTQSLTNSNFTSSSHFYCNFMYKWQ